MRYFIGDSIAQANNSFCDITQLLNLYDRLLSRQPHRRPYLQTGRHFGCV